jgi:putative FmdB family regulatory protein
MPTYEYACTKCGHHVEVNQPFGEPPPEKCEVCGGPLRKVFHPVGISFKGSGFYKNDSRSSSKKTAAKPAEKVSESPKSDSKSDSKTSDAKPSSDPKPAAKEKTA